MIRHPQFSRFSLADSPCCHPDLPRLLAQPDPCATIGGMGNARATRGGPERALACRCVGGRLASAEARSRRHARAALGWPELSGVVGHLRATLPPAKPVVVRAARLAPELLGTCARRPERFVIRLNRALTDAEATETLLHEWAHALAWSFTLDRLAREPETTREAFEAAAHDEAWGCAYSRVWREYVRMHDADDAE